MAENQAHSPLTMVRREYLAELLAELATLRERTRRRDAVEDPPPEGVWALGRVIAPPLVCAVRSTGGKCADQLGWAREIVAWWPLPEVTNG